VENEHQLEMGLKSGAFSKDTVVNISGAHYRICAPTISIDVKSCIFWTKEYLADDKPTTDKIVSSYCVFVKPLNCLKFVLLFTMFPNCAKSLVQTEMSFKMKLLQICKQ